MFLIYINDIVDYIMHYVIIIASICLYYTELSTLKHADIAILQSDLNSSAQWSHI